MIGKQCGNNICKQENFVQIILPYNTIFVSCFLGPLFLGHAVQAVLLSQTNAYGNTINVKSNLL